MSLISHNELVRLVKRGVIEAPEENINGASIDITLDKWLMQEVLRPTEPSVALKDKKSVEFERVAAPYHLHPGQFILAASAEVFNLPNDIAAEYKLKSSLARSGLQHLMAGWCDPGWNNSKLTLELKNVTQAHTLFLEEGMKIGQIVFWRCDPVPDKQSYATKGQYNGQTSVTPSKGVR